MLSKMLIWYPKKEEQRKSKCETESWVFLAGMEALEDSMEE